MTRPARRRIPTFEQRLPPEYVAFGDLKARGLAVPEGTLPAAILHVKRHDYESQQAAYWLTDTVPAEGGSPDHAGSSH